MQPMLEQLLDVNPEMIDCDLLNVQEGGSLRVKMSNDTWNTILKGYSAWTAGSQVSFNLIQFRYTTDDGLSIPYTFKIDKGEQGSEQEDIMTGVTIEYQYQGKINILKFVQDPDNPHEQDDPDGNLYGVMGHLNFILDSRIIYDNITSPFILDLDKYVNTGTREEAQYQYIIAALDDIYMDESIYNKSSRPPVVASAFLEQMPSKDHLIYKLQDALDIYNAVMQHRPMFGKMGYGKNPADPSLVKYPDTFPLYYDVYQDSKFNYTDENNFDLEFQLFINHPIGGQNPSLGYNKWGCMPFSLRFVCSNGQFIYFLGIGTENPVIYENMLPIPRLKALIDNPGVVPYNITDVAVGDQIGIEIPNNKINNISYGIWIEGCVHTVSTLFPHPTKIEYDESRKVTGFTMTYQDQTNIGILKYVISETQSDPDNQTYFTLQSRDVYDLSSLGKRVELNINNIEKFGESVVDDGNILNPSDILHCALQDAITVDETSGNISYKESSLLKDICDYAIGNDIRKGYFYTNISVGVDGPEYKTQFFVDYDVVFTSNESGNLYYKVVKIYNPLSEGKNPSLTVHVNENGIINIDANNLDYHDYYLNFDPSKDDGEYNNFYINYSSLYDKSRFVFTYNNGDNTGNVDQKIYYLHFKNTETFAKNDVIFSLYNDTNKSIEVRISEITISIAPYETITFQYLMMGSDRFIHRLYVSNVNPVS